MNTKGLSAIDRKILKNLEMAINEYSDAHGYKVNLSRFKNCISSYLPEFTTGSDWTFNDEFRAKTTACFNNFIINNKNIDVNLFWSFFGENYYPYFS